MQNVHIDPNILYKKIYYYLESTFCTNNLVLKKHLTTDKLRHCQKYR